MLSRISRPRVIFLFLLLTLSLVPSALAAPPADTPTPTAVFTQMQQQAAGPLVAHWDETTGIPRFLRGTIPFSVPGAKQSATQRAITFFSQYRALYRMNNPFAELAEKDVQTDNLGMTHVRLQQQVNGVPVWGAQMMAHFDAAGNVRAVNGTYLPDTRVDTAPTLRFDEAVLIARTNLLTDDRATINRQRSGLVVYRRGGITALAWKVQLFAEHPLGNWIVFVDAHSGSIIHRINSLETAKNRETYNANHAATSADLPGTLVCNESDPTCSAGDAAAKDAHINAGHTYDYYYAKFGRDSYNNAGATLKSSVHFSTNYNNAYWNGTQMVYGDGDGVSFSYLSGALDVVAHELTHAVTGSTADLIYEDESGALNESYSDVFGTFVEFYTDPAHANWLMGEAVYTPGTPGDALRSMSDPTQGSYDPNDPVNSGGQPDHTSTYAHYPLVIDNGGVHTNSGIPNKIAYLIAQGGTFHSVVVSGIGIPKTEQIYYRTLTHYLTAASNFWDAREASIQSCKDLIGSFGISAADCNVVQDGFAAAGIGPSTTMTQHLFLPLILRSSAGGTAASGIFGTVTDSGKPATGVELQLRKCTSSCTTQATATTDSSGQYSFTGVPSTSGSYYYVRYLNPALATARSVSSPPAGSSTQEIPLQVTLADVGQFGSTLQPESPADAAGTVTIFSDDFEGSFPGSWTLSGGHWGKSSCRASAGSYSAWVEGASGMGCGSNYHDSEDGWMVYGPFSLSDATAASLTFKLWLNSEPHYDKLCRLASTNGTDFSGTCVSGNTGGWEDKTLDLSSVYTLGNLLGQSQVWVALYWLSNSSTTYPEGGFVDNVVLQKTTSGGAAPPPAGNRVAAWYSDAINSYTAGTSVRGGDFDIADIPLVSPADGSTSSFPITFDWNRRSAPFPDLYQIEFLNAVGKVQGMGGISDYSTSQYTLSSLPSGFHTGVPVYYWNILAYGPDGYGVSHDAYKITFAALANGKDGMVTEQIVPTGQILDLDALRPLHK